ncbi:ABC transporter substrate binding protein [Variovorax sp. dw_954]|uniref:ABC transporter substrate binding protein n=1 Tax=Variovorax sp. dw_954 TaxID=2720078 RepID=UPI0021170C09|nr:ABC transporter substrate binding protein [Variovorax sp. dw_954]
MMTFGLDYLDVARRTADCTDRILKGAKPGDLPVQQASKFEMVINLKTADAPGIRIPRSMLLLADEVIK